MTQFAQHSSELDTRKGAFFKKRLKTTETGISNRIVDAGISSHFSDVFDGNFNLFPLMAVDIDGNSLEAGKAPIGTDTASVGYLLQFSSISPPSYGSADLYSANLHLHMEDINYRNNYSLPDIEIYKFKKSLPYVGKFGNLASRVDSNGKKPERVVVGSAHYSGGPQIIENFDGSDTSKAATFAMPSLYRGASGSSGTGTNTYYSTLEEAWYIDTSDFDTWTDRDDTSGANNKDAYDDAYCVNWDGYGRVVRYEVDSNGNCIPTSQNGPKKTWGDDPDYFLGYWNWEYAVANGHTDEYRGEKIHNTNPITNSLSSADSGIDVNLKEQLTTSTMSPDNTFFDEIHYTAMKESTDSTSLSLDKYITALAHPHFSTEGGSASGQVARLYSRIDTDNVGIFSFKNDKTAVPTICLVKKIPKPLPLARQNSSVTDMNQMRIRIKFMINSMNKSHRSGEQHEIPEAHISGNNIIRSFTAMLSTRAPADETFGLFLNRMNSGDVTSCGYNCANPYDGDFDANSFAVTKDHYNHTSYSNVGNTRHRTNFYNGISIMKFVHGRGFELSCDTNTDANNKFTRASAADWDSNTKPRVGQRVRGTGIPADSFVTSVTGSVSGSHSATINNNFTSESNAVDLIFEDGRADSTIGEDQSNNEPEDGTFTMFHTGHPDGTTRWNNWDAIYQCGGMAVDTGTCDFVPFVHKEAGRLSTVQYIGRDGTTFTEDENKICSTGPSRKAYKLLEDDDTGI